MAFIHYSQPTAHSPQPTFHCPLPTAQPDFFKSYFNASKMLNINLKKKHCKSCKKLPWELVGCQGVRVFLLKDVIITTSVTIVIFITITIWVFELSQFYFFSFAQFEFGPNLIIQVLSQFVLFFSFITVWVLEFCHNLGFFFIVLSQFDFV